jgi:hypothetical protein
VVISICDLGSNSEVLNIMGQSDKHDVRFSICLAGVASDCALQRLW